MVNRKPEEQPRDDTGRFAKSGHVAGAVPMPGADDEIWTHTPELQFVQFDPESQKPYTPEQVTSATKPLAPIFVNPNQDYDYRVISAVLKNTIVGSIMDTFAQMIVGDGFEPELELLDPTGDAAKDQKQLAKYDSVLKELHAVQREIDSVNDLTFVDYVKIGRASCRERV